MSLARKLRSVAPRSPQPGGPRLNCPRLALRPLTPADAGAVEALAGDWQVARMLGDMPHPLTRVAAQDWIARGEDELALAIELGDTVIGAVTVFPSVPRTAELGFWLGRSYWGMGYAREAAEAVIRHGFADQGLTAFTSGHFADNPASGRMLHALGFRLAGRDETWCQARDRHVDSLTYRLERAQWHGAAWHGQAAGT